MNKRTNKMVNGIFMEGRTLYIDIARDEQRCGVVKHDKLRKLIEFLTKRQLSLKNELLELF